MQRVEHFTTANDCAVTAGSLTKNPNKTNYVNNANLNTCTCPDGNDLKTKYVTLVNSMLTPSSTISNDASVGATAVYYCH